MTEREIEFEIADATARHQRGDAAGAESICRRVLASSPQQPDALYLLGLIELDRGHCEQAVGLLQRATAGGEEWPLAQFYLGRALAALGRWQEAIGATELAAKQEPSFVDAHLALGNLWNQARDWPRAAEAYQRVIALAPEFAPARNNLGIVLTELGRVAEAEAEYRRAIAINPSYQPALHNLSNLALAHLRADEAVALASRSVQLAPGDGDGWITLGNALRGVDRFVDAASAYQRAAEIRPDSPEARLSLIPLLTTLGQHEQAIAQARDAAARFPNRADVHRALGLALEMAGQRDAARLACAEALRLDPSMAEAAHDLAALSGQTPVSAPPEYVAKLFDDYALRFEKHLVEGLEYRAPQQLREALDAAGVTGPIDVIDLGCGTGLMAKELRGRARSIVGVDLSSKMVEMARRSGLYDRVEQADAATALRAHPAAFDLVVAADVLLYVGELNELVAAAAHALRPGGWLAFSVEVYDGEGFVLRPTRRYAHSPAYVRKVAQSNQFQEVIGRDAVLRMNEGRPVPGWVAVFRKIGGSA